MITSELLQLQALKLKREVLSDSPNFDHDSDAPLWVRETYETASNNRNICAMIPSSLFEEVERLSGLLKISKRAMIEMALRDLATSANKALDDVGFVSSSMTYRSIGDVPVDEA